MAAAPDETFYPARSRLVWRAIWRLVLCALFAASAFGVETRLLRGTLIALSVVCGLLAAVRLVPLLCRPRPVLVLMPDGLRAPALAADVVPWAAIAHSTPIVGRRSARLLLWLNAGAETRFTSSRSRRVRLRLGLARRSRLTLDLGAFDAKPWAVVRAVQGRLLDATPEASMQDALSRPDTNRQSVIPKDGPPVLAVGMVVLLVAVFVAENCLAIGPGAPVNVITLWALGGTSRAAVLGDGQPWRLVTASLLHLGVLHIAFNAAALLYAGRLLESLIGWRWFAACFAFSAVVASLVSIAWHDPETVAAGASGGIVGLFAAMGVLAFRFTSDGVHEKLLVASFQILVASIVPFLFLAQLGDHSVDVAGHVGGACAGALVGFVLLKSWAPDEVAPPYGRVALSIAASYVAVAVLALVPIIDGYTPTRDALAALAPDFPASDEAARAAAVDLLAKYPRDPRVRYAHAWMLIKKNDFAGARRDLETALADRAMLRPQIMRMEPPLRGSLAVVLAVQGRKPEAEAQLAGLCPELKPHFKGAFAQFGLCR